MSEQVKDQKAPEAAAPAEPAKPKLSDGLFKEFSLGSKLVQGSTGNELSNIKASPMDYEKKYQNSTKNQSLSAEELAKLKAEPIKKSTDPYENVKPEDREKILAEIDARIAKAKEDKDEKKEKLLMKMKDKAKKCWGPQMDRKQPKA